MSYIHSVNFSKKPLIGSGAFIENKPRISDERIEKMKVKPKKGNLLDRLIKKMIDKRK